ISVAAHGGHRPLRPFDPQQVLRDTIPYSRDEVRFAFAAPGFARGARTELRTRLAGWSDAWSDWSDKREAAWSTLPGGSYRFEVQARDRTGAASEVVSYAF